MKLFLVFTLYNSVGVRIMGEVLKLKVSPKGQITLPKRVRMSRGRRFDNPIIQFKQLSCLFLSNKKLAVGAFC